MKILLTLLIYLNSYSLELKIMTEDYPPFQFEKDKEVTGIATEITTEIFKRANIKYELSLVPWQRAYDGALNVANTCVYSTYDTPERKDLFKWVGPLAVDNWEIVATEDSKLKVSSIADLKNLRVGGYSGDGISLHLKGLGIPVQDVSFDYQNALKLKKKRIDVWASSRFSWPILAKEHGVKNLKILYSFNQLNLNLACNKSVPDEKIILMNKILKDLNSEGFTKSVFKKYGIDN